MKNYIIFQLAFVALLMGSCNSKAYEEPAPYKPVSLKVNTTIAELKAMYKGKATLIEEDVVIGGKVISTDRYGNVYRSVYIEDKTGGIEVKVGKTALYNWYHPNDTLFVKAKHLVLGAYGNFISLGAPNPTPSDGYQNVWIDIQLWIDMTIFRGRRGSPVIPTVVNSANEITEDMFGRLVTLKNMTYSPGPTDILRTWAIFGATTPGGNAQNQPFTFPASTAKMVVRTSNFAKFASEPTPAAGAVVNLTGILTRFTNNNGTTIQLILNSLEGVEVVSEPTPAP